jgi:hypothetical protein
MTKFILRLLDKTKRVVVAVESQSERQFASISWHESKALPRVRFALRRISLGQRMELTKRIIELTSRNEFLKAGQPADQLEAALADLLVSKLYLEWGLDRVEGLMIDGEPATVALLVERGPEELATEIITVLKREAGLSDEEQKN